MLFAKNTLFALAALASSVSGHMYLSQPVPLGKGVDYNLLAPLDPSGSDFPCKGHLPLLSSAGPGETWAAGSQQSFVAGGNGAGSADHGTGSCQVSLSEDGGKTWKVMKSFEGGCAQAGKSYSFTVPKEAKSGEAVFAWTWFNRSGNREMYMNCSPVTITNGGSGLDNGFPDMFKANIGNGCATAPESTKNDLKFPNPGKNVEVYTHTPEEGVVFKAPVGTCGETVDSGSGSESGSGNAEEVVDTQPSAAVPTSTAGTAPTQTYDDGMYRPTQTSSTESGSDEVPKVPETTEPAQIVPGTEYQILIVVNGETQTGKAILTAPTPAAAARRVRRSHPRMFRSIH